VEIAIISDTHMPKGWRRLPERCVDRLRTADLIVHAGDLSTLAVLHELQSYGSVVAVHGNVDDAAVRTALPQTTVVEANGARVAVIHDAGPSRGRLERMRRRFGGSGTEAGAVVFGHSHIPLHEQAADGFQIFNPGSPTERRRAPRHTMGICRAIGGRLTFELVELD
jgi:putative phosphoesterase